MSYRKARIKHDKIKLITYIRYMQQFWTEKKENNKKINVCQLHDIAMFRMYIPQDFRRKEPQKKVLVHFTEIHEAKLKKRQFSAMVTLWASVQKLPESDFNLDTGLRNRHSRFMTLLLSKSFLIQ